MQGLPVVMEGLIGSGKTTCLERLRDLYNVPIMLEPVIEWEPYLQLFYQDQRRWAFTLQMKIVQTLRDEAATLPACVIRERSIDATRHVFVKNLVERGMLIDKEVDLIDQFIPCESYRRFHHLLYIDTPPEVCMERISQRARASELSVDSGSPSISLEYLQDLQRLYKRAFVPGDTVTYIDGTQNVDAITKEVYDSLCIPGQKMYRV